MTDATLNRFLAWGTAAARAAFTPSVPSPASGPSQAYLWAESDTGLLYAYVSAAWVLVGALNASTTEQLTGTSAARFATPDSVAALWEKGSDITSAATISIGEGGFFHVTGTTTITDIDFGTDKTGRAAILVFDGALTLTHNATSLILPTGANIVTAAGDCCKVVSEGSDNVRVVWYQRKDGTAVGGGGAGALTLITETVTASSAADVTFSSISASYRDLEIRIRGRGDTAATEIGVWLQFNDDTGSNYSAALGVFNGTGSASSAQNLATTALKRLFDIPAASATASYCGTGTIVIGDYRGTTFFKSAHGQAGMVRNTSSNGALAELGGGIWISTSAITKVKVFLAAGNFVDGSVVSLYGRT